ncbi:SRPBCC family protein [Aquihabitans sp. G128]|uniref:SRPBCC family protein n=1 Tax=Aquihabitans sp. G128 TaxID=2849779 RepID=UPI001C2120FD|nr:SRPBCC family protein [Aquihabitans sp. G128]QXC60070.1 SRPBCC family protein [Aquihabitans sp. G128]
MDPLTITRSVRIDADLDAVWASVGDADGLAGWLGAAIEVDLVAGAAGSVVDHDGTSRRLVVTTVDGVAPRRQVGFTWWDEDRPDDASHVTIAVEGDGDGARVTVTETLDPVSVGSHGGRASALGGAHVGDLLDAGAALGHRWDARLGALLGAAAPALLAVGA